MEVVNQSLHIFPELPGLYGQPLPYHKPFSGHSLLESEAFIGEGDDFGECHRGDYIVYHHLFQSEMTLLFTTQKPVEHQFYLVGVEYCRIVHRLVGDEYTQRRQYKRGEPHPEPNRGMAVARHLVAGVVENVVDKEEQHRDYKRHAETALADYGPERGADEEEYDTGHGECEFL